MTKNEFLSTLRLALTGKLSQADVESHIDYYNAYIDGEVFSGKTEEQVTEELGNPRMIAKNLVASANRAMEKGGNGQQQYTYTQEGPDAKGTSENGSGSYQNYSSGSGGDTYQRYSSGSSGSAPQGSGMSAGCIIGIIVFIIIVVLAITLIARLGFFLLKFFLPVIIIMIILGIIFGAKNRR